MSEKFLKLRGIQDIFFGAMANGYAQNTPKTSIVGLPGSKMISSELGHYKVVDCYFVNPHSDKSTGQTIIWDNNVPVWTMYYGGRYAEIAIPFLKECLHRAYVTKRRFYGGRGPYFVRGKRFTYVNDVRRDSFSDFEGDEFVFDLSEQCLGHHWYRGISLLE
ncbi:MAG: DUF5680 domain-containing protein [bacterium]|nr:DUF5680 domain-containing protein [bacterium]